MLTSLAVRDVVLIDRLELGFGSGLTALTGETGAGKSILLDSLGLALGERAGAGLVREGADQCSVAATFAVPAEHPVLTLLHEAAIDVVPGEELVMRRIVGRDGRSRAFINDQAAGVALLRRAGALLVEVQGQHEQMGLADPATHRDLLDLHGVPAALRAVVADAHATRAATATALGAAETALAAASREEDWLRAAASELDKLAPAPDEEDALAAKRLSLQRAERRAEAIVQAAGELAGRDRRDKGPGAALRAASRALARAVPADLSGEPDAAVDGNAALAAEAAAELERAEEALANAEALLSRLAAESEADGRGLEAAEERLFALRAAARKHGVAPTELPDLHHQFRRRLELLDSGARDLDELRAAHAEAERAYAAGSEHLSAARRDAARRLERAVADELAPLRLGRARFVVELATLPERGFGPGGTDSVAFLIAANPDAPPAPLGRVASGGELSRLMLALKVVLAAGGSSLTLVFDEVDSGIGGATANAVGERLALIARGRQVLVVTHAPQVAARADHHLTVAKSLRAGRTVTEVRPLAAAERREEIARMLAGEHVTEAARGAAASLLGEQGALRV